MTKLHLAAGLAAVLLLPLAAAAAEVEQKQFVSGGSIHLDLSAGEYEIVAAADDRIRVSWDSRKDVDVDIVVKGSNATVTIDGPSNNGPTFRVELPRLSHIVVRMSAGDLKIRGIEGHKDVSLRAGDLIIDAGNRDQYRSVDASISIGDLSAGPFGQDKEGFFRSIKWTGKGKYDLRAHLMVGDLRLED